MHLLNDMHQLFVSHYCGSLVFRRLTDSHVSCFLENENVERLISLILRESGDRLNEQVRNIKPCTIRRPSPL